MTIYEITLEIDSDSRPAALQDTLDRIVRHTFGSSGEITNFVEIDHTLYPGGPAWSHERVKTAIRIVKDLHAEIDEERRTIQDEATDDHNIGVTRSLGWKSYTCENGTIWHNPDLEED